MWVLDFEKRRVRRKGIVFSFHCSTSNYFLDTTIIQKGLRTRFVQLQFLCVCINTYICIYADCRGLIVQDIANSFKLAPGRIGLPTYQNAAAAKATA